MSKVPLPDSPGNPGVLGLAGWGALCAALVLWSSAFVGIRATVGVFGAAHLALLRYLFASATLGTIAAIRFISLPPLRALPTVLLHGFLGFTVYHVALNYGEHTVSAGSAAFLIGAIPVFIAVFAFFMLSERIGVRGWAGIAVSMAGVALIAWGEGDSGAAGTSGSFLDIGALAVLGAAISEAMYYVLAKKQLERYGALTYTTWTVWAGTLFMLVFIPGFFDVVSAAPVESVWAVAYLGVGPGALAYLGWNYAISRASVSRLGITQFSLPAMTIGMGWLFLNELPGIIALVGGVVALGGVALARSGKGGEEE